MLYQLHELQRAFLNPMTAWAGAAAEMYSSPVSPLSYMPFARETAASYELMHRLGKEYEKPGFGITQTHIDGKAYPVTEEVVVNQPFCELRHFVRHGVRGQKGATAKAKDPTILLVAPLSGHHATLLRDTVRALLPAHDVYVTDWRDARMVPLTAGKFHLDDYIRYVIGFIQLLGPDVHVISVCQPTVPVLAAISLMAANKDPKSPKTMTMMGGPIDTRKNPTQVNALAMTKPYSWFETNVIYRVPANYPGVGRKVYPGFLQHAGFVAMNPDRHLKSHWDFFKDLVKNDGDSAESHRQFYDEYNAVLDMDADYYLDTIKLIFQEQRLATGKWDSAAYGNKLQRVTPSAIIKTALFTIEGELDDISGSGQTEAAHGLCSGIPKAKKQHFTAPECGHYGIFAGRRWREVICPKIAAFIRQNAK
jgi:poly(3-hydroxybutyrate) depolymerase